MQIVPLPLCLLFAEPIQRSVGSEARQTFLGFARRRLGIFEAADGFELRAGLLRNPVRSAWIVRGRNSGGACIFRIRFQHSDDSATGFGPHLHEGVDGGVIDFHALRGEEFRDAAVGRPALTLGGDEIAVRFEFGGRVGHGQTGSNKLQQLSNTFEPGLRLLEMPWLTFVAVQGKMSDKIIAVEGRSQSEARSSVGTGTHWKGGRRCFG
jgi:hypothetical protein